MTPQISSSTNTYTSVEASPVVFQCTATGIPTPSITWYRNGTVLSSISDPRITVGSPSQQLLSSGVYQVTQTLTITNTADSDSGNYSCVGNNSVGMDTSAFVLSVRGKQWNTTLLESRGVQMCLFPYSASCNISSTHRSNNCTAKHSFFRMHSYWTPSTFIPMDKNNR